MQALLARNLSRLPAWSGTPAFHARQGCDIVADGRWLFEVGGKKKGFSQIKGVEESFVVADDMEIGYGNKIPLWLFGMMY